MASQVLSGANNASYTNNTGQNVRLIINYMSNVTSMTWADVNVTAESTTIGKDIQNITGEFRKLKQGTDLGAAVDFQPNSIGSLSRITELDTVLVTGFGASGTDNRVFRAISDSDKNERKANQNNIIFRESGEITSLFYVPKTISRGGNFPVELMLANGQSFSAVCGSYNAVVIKEDGT